MLPLPWLPFHREEHGTNPDTETMIREEEKEQEWFILINPAVTMDASFQKLRFVGLSLTFSDA